MNLTAERITDFPALQDLRPDWQSLTARLPESTDFFATWDYTWAYLNMHRPANWQVVAMRAPGTGALVLALLEDLGRTEVLKALRIPGNLHEIETRGRHLAQYVQTCSSTAYRNAVYNERRLGKEGAVRKMTPADQPWLEKAEQLLAKGLGKTRELGLRFAMGKFCDDIKDYDSAFAHYQRGNQLKKTLGKPFQREHHAAIIDQLISAYNIQVMHTRQPGSNDSRRPVLIVGMPRSGTSLTEQILASHPDTFGAGELRYWGQVLPKDCFLELPYEQLVEDQEGWSRKIIEFIGLPWDERCLEFHQTDRKVGTASNWQARQPIYKTSKERWRNYEQDVSPLLPLLELYDPERGQL